MQTHRAATQVWEAGQAVEHEPQWLESVRVSTQWPGDVAVAPQTSGVEAGHWQAPGGTVPADVGTQVALVGHSMAQAPQLPGSLLVSTQRPGELAVAPQTSGAEAGHWQAPVAAPTEVGAQVAPVAHAAPGQAAPQWRSSWARSKQAEAEAVQSVKPV